jgi:hypothetical protein
VKLDFEHAEISEKLRALLAIAGKVQLGGKNVTAKDVERARKLGATDLEIHDTVLIAAVFCLCNRYVNGLATWTPEDPEFYRQRAAIVATNGYVAAIDAKRHRAVVKSARTTKACFGPISSGLCCLTRRIH